MKYIVYMTVNVVNNKIYIGVHGERNGKFDGYIGCGVTSTSKNLNSTPFQKAVQKYGYDKFIRTTLASFDTAEEAYKLESILVDKYFISRKDTYNATLGGLIGRVGGNGTSKKIIQYTLQGKFVKVWDSTLDIAAYYSTVKSRALSSSIDKVNKTCYGYQWRRFTEDYPLLITQVSDSTQVPMAQYTMEGDLVQVWKSADKVARTLFGLKNGQQLKRAARDSKPYHNFLWLMILEGENSAPEKIDAYIDPREIVGLDSNNNIVKEFKDKAEAKLNGFSNVTNCLLGKRNKCKGLKWMYKKDYIKII